MSEDLAPRSLPGDSGEAELAAYRPVSKLAVASLLVALSAPLAVFEPTLYVVPIAGVLLGGLALWRIARQAPSLLGRKAAVAALALSVGAATAAPAHWITYRWLVRREARRFAMAWFDFLRDGQPQKAYQLTLGPRRRESLGEGLWDFYRNNPEAREELTSYVAPANPGERPRLVRTLLALGPKAQVRYFATEGQGRREQTDWVYQVFAVTYEDRGQPQTFFVGIELKRFLMRATGGSSWMIFHVDGGIRPVAFGPATAVKG